MLDVSWFELVNTATVLWIHMCMSFHTKISENRIKGVWDSLYWEITIAHWWHRREGKNQEPVLSKLLSFHFPDLTLALTPPCLALTQRVTSLLYLPLWEHFELYLFFIQILWPYTFQRVSNKLFFSFNHSPDLQMPSLKNHVLSFLKFWIKDTVVIHSFDF